jgi:hypothetical protein
MQECNATAQRIETASAPTALAAVSALGAAKQHEPVVGLNVHKGTSAAAVAEPGEGDQSTAARWPRRRRRWPRLSPSRAKRLGVLFCRCAGAIRARPEWA